MATVIRFSRHGTKKRPYYRIVVQNQTAPRDGRFIEHIGSFDPLKGNESVCVERDRLEYWLSTGAKMSTSVKNRIKLIRRQWARPAAAEGAAAREIPTPKKIHSPKESGADPEVG